MRMAEQLHAYFPDCFDSQQAQTNPVVVIGGMSHAQFLAGPAPSAVVKSDLLPDIPTEQAHQEVAQVVGAFLRAQVLRQAQPELAQAVQRTQQLLGPYVEALRLEGFPYLTRVGQPPLPADGSRESPWTVQVLQRYSQQVAAQVPVNISSGIFGMSFEHQHPKPLLEQGTLHATSATSNAYSQVAQKLDVQYGPLATSSLGWKFLQLDWLLETAKLPVPADLHQPTCKEVNQWALDWAKQNLPATQAQRHAKYGDPIALLNDTSVLGSIGPLWVLTNLKVGTDPATHATTVQGVVESSPTHGHMPFAGAFYCKTLSPGYALELLGTETLRRQRALSTDPTHDNSDPGPQAQVLV